MNDKRTTGFWVITVIGTLLLAVLLLTFNNTTGHLTHFPLKADFV